MSYQGWRFLIRNQSDPNAPSALITRTNKVVWNVYPEGRSGLCTIIGYCWWEQPRSLNEVRSSYSLRAYWTPADKSVYREVSSGYLPFNARRYKSGSFTRKIRSQPRIVNSRSYNFKPLSSNIYKNNRSYNYQSPPPSPPQYTPISSNDNSGYERYNSDGSSYFLPGQTPLSNNLPSYPTRTGSTRYINPYPQMSLEDRRRAIRNAYLRADRYYRL